MSHLKLGRKLLTVSWLYRYQICLEKERVGQCEGSQGTVSVIRVWANIFNAYTISKTPRGCALDHDNYLGVGQVVRNTDFPRKNSDLFKKRIYTDFCNYLKTRIFLRRPCEDNVFM